MEKTIRSPELPVAGPWNHAVAQGSAIPWCNSIRSDTSLYFRQKIEALVRVWLKDKGALPLREALLFQTGSDTWTSFDSWPPREAKTSQSLFPRDGKSFDPPSSTNDQLSTLRQRPGASCALSHRPIDMTYPEDHRGGWTLLVEDQRFVDERPTS